MKIDPEVLSKLTKILRLAGDKAAMPGEVEAAMARARAIAVEHNIELSAIDLNDNTKTKEAFQVVRDSVKPCTATPRRYHRWVYRVIKQVFDVHVVLSTDSGPKASSRKRVSQVHLIGDPLDVAIVKEIFPFLEKSFAAIYSRAVSSGLLQDNAADANGCWAGVYTGILETNKREEEQAVKSATGITGNQYALVLRKKEELIEAAAEKFFPNAKAGPARSQQRSVIAQAYGHAEGRKINLRQVGQSAKLGQLR